MKLKNVVYLFLILAVAFSCSNEIIPDAEVTSDPGSTLVFEKMKMPDGTIHTATEFQYNTLGQLTSQISYGQLGVVGSKRDYFYDAGQLVRTSGMSDVSSSTTTPHYFYFYSTYEYEQGLLVRENSFSKQGADYEQRSYTIYEYNEAALPVKRSVFSMAGELARYTTYAYDQAGNISAAMEYDVVNNLGLTLETTYEHDSGKNPFKTVYTALELIPYSINSNNIAKTVSINHVYPSTPTGDVVKSVTNFKQYNLDGYPVLFSQDGGLDIVYEYK